MINYPGSYRNGEHSSRLVKHLGALEWPPRSPDKLSNFVFFKLVQGLSNHTLVGISRNLINN